MTNETPGQLKEDFAEVTVIYADNAFEKKALERTLTNMGSADKVRVELREPRYTYGC